MDRRRFLSVSVLSFTLFGCLDKNFSGETETGFSRSTVTDTETLSPEGATPECWPSMCEGTKLAEVIVADCFSGEVNLRAECRDEEFSIRPGESIQIDRKEDAEACGISLSIDGERVSYEEVEGYESVVLTISSDGEIEDERIVY